MDHRENRMMLKKHLQRSGLKAEYFLLLLIVASNTTIVTNWYFGGPEKVISIIKEGVEIPVKPRSIYGHLDNMILKDDGEVEFRGWAFDGRNSRIPDDILLSYDGKNISWEKNNDNRPGLVNAFGDAALGAGFKFVVQLTLFKDNKINNSKVRLFAISKGVASELKYPRGFK